MGAGPIGRYRWLNLRALVLRDDGQLHRPADPLAPEAGARQGARLDERPVRPGERSLPGRLRRGAVFLGWLVDRVGTRIGYALSIAAWSLAAISHSFAGTVAGFTNARMALGLGEGGNFPSAIKAVALWFPKRERAFATALFNAGANVGAIAAPAFVPWLADTWGWRSAFVAAGIAGFVWLSLWLPNLRHPGAKSEAHAGRARAHSERLPGRGSRRRKACGLARDARQARGVVVHRREVSHRPCVVVLPHVVARLLQEDARHGFEAELGAPDVDLRIVTVLSIIAGTIPGVLVRRGLSISRARKTSMLFFAVLVVPVLGVTRVGVWPAVLLIGLAGAAHQAWSANLFTPSRTCSPSRPWLRSWASAVWPARSAVCCFRFTRETAGCVTARPQHHRGLRDPVLRLWLCIPRGVRAQSRARAEVRARHTLIGGQRPSQPPSTTSK